jgi:oxygen-independent coproporphyrinogen-3 oxidase
MTTALRSTTTIPGELAAYAYSYPHKSSYGPLSPPVSIADAWRVEDVSGLSLYAHVPFCEMRCGFCNLFTQSRGSDDVVSAYLSTLFLQMEVVRACVPEASFAQFAIGGGTPTYLTAHQLAELLRRVETTFGQSIRGLPTSVETSPATATLDRLDVLAGFGVQRVSLGVQSFRTDEAAAIGRPQRPTEIYRALDRIRGAGFDALNIDLVYGEPGQTVGSWLFSLREALRYRPEELYLYPLYVRPETGLAKRGKHPVDHRADLYHAARELLREHGYVQSSLRGFRLPVTATPSTYTCQRDGMIGLGCGARSYTRRLHYATRFATTQAGIRVILRDWIAQSDTELAVATHGIWLTPDEQRRRYAIMSLLQAEGLSLAEFRTLFGMDGLETITGLGALIDRGWAIVEHDRCILTPDGLEHSDVVGPLLYSGPVRERLREFVELPVYERDEATA